MARSALLAALLSGSAGAATDPVVDCEAFKTAWNTALQRAEPGRPDLAFEDLPGRVGESRVGNLPGIEARMTCREGKLGRLELGQVSGDPASGSPADMARRLLAAAAAVLVASESELTAAPAAEIVTALRAEARAGHDAVSAWGPYEVTYGRTGGRETFVLDLAEN